MAKKRKKVEATPAGSEWLTTYSDLISLLLCFFVALFDPGEVNPVIVAAMVSAFENLGLGANTGGNTFSVGRSADLGNNLNSLPAIDKGRSLGTALRTALALFNAEVRSNKMKVTQDERGIIISLAGDAFFNPASARVNIEETRDLLVRVAQMLNANEVGGRKVRIEGHTDNVDIDPAGPWQDNWQLSSERARSVLRYLTDFGVDERRFQVAGFADTVPVASNATPEGRAYNRRVDIVIIDDAHL
jgi:chemotaxis protein MotB